MRSLVSLACPFAREIGWSKAAELELAETLADVNTALACLALVPCALRGWEDPRLASSETVRLYKEWHDSVTRYRTRH